jgi:uncharacterized protein (DUF1330 family)
MTETAPVYLVGNYEVTNPDSLTEYVQKSTPIVQRHGGRMLGFDPATAPLEGKALPLLAVFEFPSMKNAQEFYNSPDYAELIPLRQQATNGGFLALIQGPFQANG